MAGTLELLAYDFFRILRAPLLGVNEGFAPIAGLTLALYARPALDDDGAALRDSLEALCERRAAH